MCSFQEFLLDDRPLVSVIIPTYDRPTFLQNTVESVMQQTYDNLEIVVVDDHSTPPAESTLDNLSYNQYKGDVVTIRHDQNRGVCAARNSGIEAASGQLIALLDDDDYWLEDKIEKQVEAFKNSSPKTGVIYTNTKITDDNGKVTGARSFTASGDLTKRLLRRNFATVSTLLVHSEAIENSGGFDQKLPNWEDWEWCIRLSEKARFEVVPEPLVVIQKGDHDKRSDSFERKRDRGLDLFLEAIGPIASEYGYWFERSVQGWVRYQIGTGALRRGYFSDARGLLLRAIYFWPAQWRFYFYLFAGFGGRWLYSIGKFLKRKSRMDIN
jgi:glycosyltransferase involved in cell wall biosynthesis